MTTMWAPAGAPELRPEGSRPTIVPRETPVLVAVSDGQLPVDSRWQLLSAGNGTVPAEPLRRLDPDIIAFLRGDARMTQHDLGAIAGSVERQMRGQRWPAPIPTPDGDAALRVSVVVPVRLGGVHLSRLVGSLEASTLPRNQWELIVVDDASEDGSWLAAAGHADLIVRVRGQRMGPAYARNRGAALSRAPYVAFLDADVTVFPHTLESLVQTLDSDPTRAATVGVYASHTDTGTVASRYRTVLDHVQQVACAGPVESFFAGCGIIRRDAFLQSGGFDEWQFRAPEIEDIELGHRLVARGERIVLDPQVAVVHHKRWTLPLLVADEVSRRTLPGARALGGRWHARRSPSIADAPRQSVMVLLSLALVVGASAAAVGWMPWLVPAVVALAALAVDAPLLVAFGRTAGLGAALVSAPVHLLLTTTNGVAFLGGTFLRWLFGEARPHPVYEAWAEVGLAVWPPVPRRPTV